MTQTSPSSSADPDGSKQSPDAADFADALIGQLDQRSKYDLLIRWMVERLAELQDAAVGSPAKKKELEALVLAIWERRAGWGTGWPTPAMLSLAELVGTTSSYFGGNLTGLAFTHHSIQRELVLWYIGVIDQMDTADLGIDNGLEAKLNDDEAQSARLHRALIEQHTEMLAEAPDGDLIKHLRGLIVDQNRERLDYFDRFFSGSSNSESD